MSCDPQWDHQFCLACDKQTDGATYCSESCRLADFAKTTSTPSSTASSPAFTGLSFPFTLSTVSLSSAASASSPSSSTGTRFYLSPAYDFSHAAPYGSTPARSFYAPNARQHAQQQRRAERQAGFAQPARALSPSSSHSSLASVRSGSSAAAAAAETSTLSEKARNELRAYAISFEQVRLQRRRSY